MAYKNVPNIVIENARIIFGISEEKNLSIIGLVIEIFVLLLTIQNRLKSS